MSSCKRTRCFGPECLNVPEALEKLHADGDFPIPLSLFVFAESSQSGPDRGPRVRIPRIPDGSVEGGPNPPGSTSLWPQRPFICVSGPPLAIPKRRRLTQFWASAWKTQMGVYMGLHGVSSGGSDPPPSHCNEGGGAYLLPPLLRLLSLRTAPPLKAEVQKVWRK